MPNCMLTFKQKAPKFRGFLFIVTLHHLKRFIYLALFINSVFVSDFYSQSDSSLTAVGIIKPSTLTTHPLGIFMMRVEHNFMTTPTKKLEFTFNIAAGNVWLPLVKTYQPTDLTDKKLMNSYIWHDREYNFNPNSTPNKAMQLHADAVIHAFKPQINLPITNRAELKIILPFYYFDKGNAPFTYINNDKTIEDFHTRHKGISGGEDPFARRVYGFNKVNINYVDENGRTININKNTLVFAGIENHYYYYPNLNTKKIKINWGLHSGLNLSNYNRSLDLGVSTSIVKSIKINTKTAVALAIGGSIVKSKLGQLKNNVILNTNPFIGAGEGELAYIRKIKKSYFSIGLNYFVQTRYNKKKEFDSLVLTGNRSYTTHWHWAISQFYETLETWSLIFSYSKKTSFSIYIKEDLHVNNAPDIQTGMMFQIPF